MQTTSRGYKKPEITDTLEESLPMLQETISKVNDDINNIENGQTTQNEAISALQTTQSNHAGNKNNPHDVTANQVLPAQAGKAGKILGTDGENSAWIDKPAVMSGATANEAGTSGLMPAPAAGDQTKFFRGDGTYQTIDINELKRVLSMGGMI